MLGEGWVFEDLSIPQLRHSTAWDELQGRGR